MSEHQLRDLARRITEVTTAHPACSQAGAAVRQLTDHLCAMARCHEANLELDALRRVLEESSCQPEGDGGPI